MQRTINHARLLIKDIEISQSGEFTVTASNHYGNKTAKCIIRVLGNERTWKFENDEILFLLLLNYFRQT